MKTNTYFKTRPTSRIFIANRPSKFLIFFPFVWDQDIFIFIVMAVFFFGSLGLVFKGKTYNKAGLTFPFSNILRFWTPGFYLAG